MGVSYDRLWKTLKEKNIGGLEELAEALNEEWDIVLSEEMISDLSYDENVPDELLYGISNILKVDISDIVEFDADDVTVETGDYTVAFMGRCGAGKSSLINALFGTDFEVNVVEECTKQLDFEHRNIDGRDICLIDSPGTGAGIIQDERYLPIYKKLVSTVDCIVWVLQANVKADSGWQKILEKIRGDINKQCRFIYCLSHADVLSIDPDVTWPVGGQPSEEHLKYIEERKEKVLGCAEDVDVLPSNGEIIVCSATRNYNLDKLRELILANNT